MNTFLASTPTQFFSEKLKSIRSNIYTYIYIVLDSLILKDYVYI